MRYAFVAAGLVAVAYADAAGKGAGKTVTEDVTVTSCDATKTDCVYWGDWAASTTEDGSNTTKTKDCGSTTSTSTGTVTYTKAYNGEVVTKTVTAVVTKAKECDPASETGDNNEWEDYEVATTTESDKGCGYTTTTSTGKVTFTKKANSEVVTKDVTSTITKAKDCATTVTDGGYNGGWGDAYISTVDACGPTTKTETKTGAVTFTIPDGKVYTKTVTSTITTTGYPASCTKTTDDGSNSSTEYWGDWATEDGCGPTTKTVTEPATYTYGTKTITKDVTKTVTEVPESCTAVDGNGNGKGHGKGGNGNGNKDDGENDDGNNDDGYHHGHGNGGKNDGENDGEDDGENDDGKNNNGWGKGGNGNGNNGEYDANNNGDNNGDNNGGWGKGNNGGNNNDAAKDCGPVTKTTVVTETVTYGGKTVTKEKTEYATETPADCTTVDGNGNNGWGKGGNNGDNNGNNNGGYGDKNTVVAPVTLTSTTACGSYTGTGAPSWFAYLPTDVASSIGAKWTAGAPADWCYYTYSTGAATGGYGAKPTGGATAVDADGSSATKTGAWAQYTGAANANTGSLAFAGLAALAAAIMA